MVNTQEIIERSVYSAILSVAVQRGYSLNPLNYLPATLLTKVRFENDKQAIILSGKSFIGIYGAGNNQSKGIKECPRITIEPQGFYPGDIGFPRQFTEKTEDGNYLVSESNYVDSVDQVIDIHLVTNSTEDMRVLHNILNTAIPQRGYIKPHTYELKPFDGNIYIQLSNFFSLPDNDKGIMEKVYQFTIKDTILDELFISGETITPIKDISILIDDLILLNSKI